MLSCSSPAAGYVTYSAFSVVTTSVLLLLLLPKVLLSLLVLRQVVDILPRQHPRQIRFAVSLESAAYYSWIDDPQYMCRWVEGSRSIVSGSSQ
jgi:hypothetical protein